MVDLLFQTERSKVIGAAIEVHRILGPGYLEAVYQEALEIEFGLRGIPFDSQKELEIRYKDRALKKKYVPDFLCFGKIVVEIKAMERLTDRETSIAINYLKSTGYRVCLLINFGAHGKVEIVPVVL
ncbi:MAG: GxxExxY protein [Planctomycetes bacterium]|nr:GxxExxY protein [Planctomycetota bacterium]